MRGKGKDFEGKKKKKLAKNKTACKIKEVL
jgi:hypothetical protein